MWWVSAKGTVDQKVSLLPVSLQSDCEKWHKNHGRKDGGQLDTTTSTGSEHEEYGSEEQGPASSHALTHNSMPFCLIVLVRCFDIDKYVQKTFLVNADFSN